MMVAKLDIAVSQILDCHDGLFGSIQALLDQNLALKWIYENAAEFGGDKERITIGGESAGSWSVGYHLVFKKSWPYFRNAILQSGTPFRPYYGTRLLSSDEANLIATNIGKSVDCIDQNSLLNCLQSVSVDLINNKSYEFTTYAALVRDSNVFDQEPKQLFEKGEFKQCRILTGSNNYEELNMVDFDIPGYNVSDLKGGKLTSFKKLLSPATTDSRLFSSKSSCKLILTGHTAVQLPHKLDAKLKCL